jgi:hypothetical protein
MFRVFVCMSVGLCAVWLSVFVCGSLCCVVICGGFLCVSRVMGERVPTFIHLQVHVSMIRRPGE